MILAAAFATPGFVDSVDNDVVAAADDDEWKEDSAIMSESVQWMPPSVGLFLSNVNAAVIVVVDTAFVGDDEVPYQEADLRLQRPPWRQC